MGVVQLNIILLQRVTGRPGLARRDMIVNSASEPSISKVQSYPAPRVSLILTQQGMLYF
ncbi:hypothetical protein L210DRAFT_3518668 [Boletus edulis BED1]|uniref:Uncharacterized protein n=1 Tax=Boletus edulis BED1 TaxID=1328754 RepID=A0AAD4BCC4_BOLED|nr:hypothetical protein L210DRAFT_3578388 [Boletus edulis BED1]KAF8452445.1 hypothetical protein L210DRAFT_3518668 [Boletus edulis BED1]